MRAGADARLATAALTYTEMLLQVARDYPGLPDPRGLTVSQIVFFYNGLRDELTRHTRPKPSPFTAKPRPRKR